MKAIQRIELTANEEQPFDFLGQVVRFTIRQQSGDAVNLRLAFVEGQTADGGLYWPIPAGEPFPWDYMVSGPLYLRADGTAVFSVLST